MTDALLPPSPPNGSSRSNGFLWGAATAAAQIEGAAHTDGRRDSIWDTYSRLPGSTANGDTPEVAVDHYHRMPQDVALMRELGLDSYRFSISWSRVKPDDATPNPAGLDFYSRLVDELLGAGILPWLTLYHWDLPQPLQDVGGWTNRDLADRFVDYAALVHETLGDRVQHWTTFNEPFCSALLGYASGEHAPGIQDPASALSAIHHQHLAHGRAVSALRELGAQHLGITLNLTTAVPADPNDPSDLDAARRIDAIWNRAFLEPLIVGAYPDDFLADVEGLGFESVVHDGDLVEIAQPIDFLGVNYYHDDSVSGRPLPADTPPGVRPDIRPTSSPFPGSEFVTFPSRGLPVTSMGWEINADGLRSLLLRLGATYPTLPPLYITENGSAWDDEVEPDGSVRDRDRVAYLEAHVAAVQAAITEGADVRGYFAWSLLDNYEWAWGYEKRFGIVRVDYDTQLRTVKDSGRTFAALAAKFRSLD